MRTALLEHPVRGVTASVCAIDEKKNTLKVNKIDGLSKLHNFAYDDKGIRVWRAYGIGPGKLLSFDDVITEQQGKTGPIVQESGDFFTKKEARQLDIKNPERMDTEESTEEGQLFECSEPGCEKLFKSFCELEIHAEIGSHGNKPMTESCYDRIRREWAERFSTVDPVHSDGSTSSRSSNPEKTTIDAPPSDLSQGWALSKPPSARRKGQQPNDADDQTELEDILAEEEENNRQQVINSIIEEIGLRHPICHDVYDLCEYHKCSKHSKFNVQVLKTILKAFDIPFKSKDRKKDLVDLLAAFVQQCSCFE
ncbi:hypothetical protein ACROYT_G030093 [Oculina patagonica]